MDRSWLDWILKRTRPIKKIIFFITLLLITTKVSALDIYSDKALLINLDNNQILIDELSEAKTSIASLTKIMTTIVALENIDNLEEKVLITKQMFDKLDEENLYQVGLKVGQTPTYNDLLYATLISSGADATRALTSKFTEDEFVELMNKKAKTLNLNNTHFTNPIGLDDDEHYSTLRDVQKLLDYALKNKKFKEIFETEKYIFSDKTLTIESSVAKTGKYYKLDTSLIKGAKTGYTLDAERCLASIATDEVNNINYMLITTNASNNPEHVMDAVNIYNYYFDNYKNYEIFLKGDTLKTIKTKYSKTKEINLTTDKEILMYYDKTFNKDLVKIEYNGLEEVKPNDKIIGNIKVYYDNKLLYEKEYKNNIKFSILEFIKTNFLIILIITTPIIYFITKKGTNH